MDLWDDPRVGVLPPQYLTTAEAAVAPVQRVWVFARAQAEPDQLGPNGEWWCEALGGYFFGWYCDPNPFPRIRLWGRR